ncbi:ABC transporter ATP-binding protein [Aliikangiella coralliicola]|uniref:ABC transporter ATP-binding protein n=1 Tax=Aliikangiella coralliicola TaxID=2592383 RepID=A0A545TW70_9GAMM|nr:ABC transporter ATP-binding protein [Aliikangiella coralliicola]TQV81473.1 ABC transporter ATP-binding protein [Aliikangiella coralliicola]
MTEKAIEIIDLKKKYANRVEALKGISFSVEKGDFIALLGPNGAGKSTTIGVICSLVNKSSGTVKVFGHSIDSELEAAKRCIGLVPQEFNFSQFETCRQIVVTQAGYYGVTRAVANERAEKILKQLALWEKRDTQARELSGGMKRRLMIARALMHEPKVLILDEPTAGVDIEIRRSMWEFLTKINKQGTTIVLTTHYLEEAEQLCRNIAIINHGEIIENTTMKDLISRLDRETFVLDVDKTPQEFPCIDEVCFRHRDDSSIEIDVPKSAALNNVFEWLTKQEIKVLSMRNKSNRLEELFVQLTEKNNEN